MARAILRRFRESPRKVRVVADMIRGRSVEDAMSILRMQQRKAARMLAKVLGSAIANATENEKADSDKLVVSARCSSTAARCRSAGWRARWAAPTGSTPAHRT